MITKSVLTSTDVKKIAAAAEAEALANNWAVTIAIIDDGGHTMLQQKTTFEEMWGQLKDGGIYLCEDDCEKLGITKGLRAGTKVTLQASAIIVSSTESVESDGDDAGNDISLSLQITDLGLQPQGVVRNAAAELYGAD